MMLTSTILILLAAASPACRASGLDRLLERLGATAGSLDVSSEPPPADALLSPPSTGPPRLRHHSHRQAVREFSDDEDQSEEDDTSTEAQADSANRLFSKVKGSHKFDWKKIPTRKTSEKTWNEYRTTKYQSPGGVSAVVVPRGENQEHAHDEVFRHNAKMARETVCRVPQTKVIRVSDHYPSASKVYMPACTKLHQCAQDTGCCPPTQKCGPKTTHRVELYFYVLQTTSVVGTGGNKRPPAALGIEKLPFYNHTECECQDRTDEMPRDIGHLNSVHPPQPPVKQHSNTGCECPSEYTVRSLSNGSCSCDCFDKQRDCIKYKRGKEYFNHQDRLCIATGSCTHPSCDFGVYMKRIGRCPRKHERLRPWLKYT